VVVGYSTLVLYGFAIPRRNAKEEKLAKKAIEDAHGPEHPAAGPLSADAVLQAQAAAHFRQTGDAHTWYSLSLDKSLPTTCRVQPLSEALNEPPRCWVVLRQHYAGSRAASRMTKRAGAR